MRKLFFLSLITLAFLSAKASAQNLVLNPSFESNVASVPTSWNQYSPNNTNTAAQVVVGIGKTGTNFLRFDGPCDVLRYQDIVVPQAGLYSLKAWVRSSGGVNYTVLYGRIAGSPDVTQAIGMATGVWTQVVINNINITSGSTIQVGIQVGANAAGQWVEVDDVELVASAYVATNFVKNPGFEANNAVTATPANWGKWTGSALPNALAQATVVTGGSHAGNYHGRIEGGPADVLFVQGITGLANGTYTFKGWFRNSGPIGWANVTIKNFGLPQIDKSVGASMPVWTEVVIPDIVVSTGTLQIDINSNGSVGQFLEIDDLELTLNTNLSNRSFSFDTISIYPNPVKNNLLNISNSNADSYGIRIFNLLGKNVFSEKNVSGNKTINTDFLRSGIYLVMVSNGTDSLAKKIIIQ